MLNDIYIGRQPIVDRNNEIFAYELLFRALDDNGNIRAFIVDEVSATCKVLVNTLNYFGTASLIGDKLAFVNISQEFLLDDIIFTIPKDNFVLEILEHTQITENVMNRIKELKNKGYKIALDDFVFTKKYLDNFSPIFKYLNFIKLDIPFLDENVLASYFEKLKKYDIIILAEKVETREAFAKYKSLGCELFQGYFFAKPNIIIQKVSDIRYTKIFQLINMINDESSNIKKIAKEFKSEVDLVIQLLKFINSAHIGLKHEVRSIQHLITMFGKKPLRQWLLLISASKGESFDKAVEKNPILNLALNRANIMEKISKKIQYTKAQADEASFVGILSLADILLNIKLESILKEISVEDEIKEAIIGNSGQIGILLKLAKAIETFDVSSIESLSSELNLTPADIANILIEKRE